MKKLELIRKLEQYPVLNLKIVKEAIKKNSEYAKLVVYRLKKEKLVSEIEKNKYTLQKEPIVVASNMVWPCYISGWASLRYYNLTEQLPKVISVVTTRMRRNMKIMFNNSDIEFVKVKPKYFFGYKKEMYGSFNIFIADREKAVIDSILFKKISFSEIFEIVKNNWSEFDETIMINYLLKIKNKALIKRFGYLLEKLGCDNYDKLKKFIDEKYIPLESLVKLKGNKNKKWKIIENVKL